MEEEIHYSSVVFKGEASAPRNNEEVFSVYSSVKSKKPLTSKKENKEDDAIYTQVEPKNLVPSAPPNQIETVSSDIKKGKQKRKIENAPKVQASGSRLRHLLCLGIMCFLLCAIIIGIIIYFTMETNKQTKNISALETKNKQLTLERRDLQNQTEDLKGNIRKLENQTEQLNAEKRFFENQTKEMIVNMTILQKKNEQLRKNSDRLNKIQTVISKYTNFPGDLFCPNGVCQTCPKDWIQYNESCYFFNHYISPWKTWNDSRQLCQSNKSDLVVISSPDEQTFIKSRIEYYYDFWHGYWIGLRKVNNNWIWVDGSQDTLGYWNNPGSSENFALLVQNATLNQSWIQNRNGFENRFICEIKAFIF